MKEIITFYLYLTFFYQLSFLSQNLTIVIKTYLHSIQRSYSPLASTGLKNTSSK